VLIWPSKFDSQGLHLGFIQPSHRPCPYSSNSLPFSHSTQRVLFPGTQQSYPSTPHSTQWYVGSLSKSRSGNSSPQLGQIASIFLFFAMVMASSADLRLFRCDNATGQLAEGRHDKRLGFNCTRKRSVVKDFVSHHSLPPFFPLVPAMYPSQRSRLKLGECDVSVHKSPLMTRVYNAPLSW